MIVISLTDCPLALRGDLSKWLQEINSGVYVGQLSTRVRDELWKRVRDSIKSGRATMVFSTNNEQRMDFRVHNTSWEPIDFDGLKLMLRPSPARLKQQSALRSGFSNAAQIRKAKQMSRRQGTSAQLPTTYLVVDVLTTGPSIREHEIREIEALLVHNGTIEREFQAIANEINGTTKTFAISITIDNKVNVKGSLSLPEAMADFAAFAGALPVITHREDHVYGFLRAVCAANQLPLFANRCIDTLYLARRHVEDAEGYHLEMLLKHLGLSINSQPTETSPCMATKLLYEKLIEMV